MKLKITQTETVMDIDSGMQQMVVVYQIIDGDQVLTEMKQTFPLDVTAEFVQLELKNALAVYKDDMVRGVESTKLQEAFDAAETTKAALTNLEIEE